MAWVLLVVALGIGVGLIINTYGVNRAAIVLLVCMLVAVVGAIYYTRVDRAHSGVIATEAIELDNFSMRRLHGDSYELLARVKNRSPDGTLTQFGISVTAADCDDANVCVVVGEQQRDVRVTVPPSQARDISVQFQFADMRPEGALRWDHNVDYTRGH